MRVRTFCTTIFTIIAIVILISACRAFSPINIDLDLTYKEGDGYVDVLKDDKVVARYVYKDTPKPYIYPVVAPNGETVTRDITPDADHPHHRSFWVGFGNVNGVDFWGEGENSGKIVQKKLYFDSVSPGYWNIHALYDWVGPDGKVLMLERRRYSFLSCDHGLLISTMIWLQGKDEEVKLDNTKEGFFAIRLAQGMQHKDGTGEILNSEGQKNNDCWGKRAKWCSYTGKVNGKVCGITIFDVPTNHGFPTYWHVRDYGLFAANPFGGAEFTEDPANDSTLTLRPMEERNFIYITLIHDGKLSANVINNIAEQTAGGGQEADEPWRDKNMKRLDTKKDKPVKIERSTEPNDAK